ncbi:glutaredoxin family protein [[Limnothrix rosea] IAM M-220]|uniref:glutaredoxin family protein n=1 Tax=[Limnothrix rosea] IAM M-220 TaxID=454133 RepID=UPI00095FB06C|nr:glutaredoxin family protein [[Limnothrix rosea] IAM M-220]OKH19261.1 thioredoxin family protein [[Limnothrix rosea] IAM M-220]
MHHLIFYSKPGCHLCEGLQEKLTRIKNLSLQIEVRDITKNVEWFEKYQYEIPVLTIEKNGSEMTLPRFSPRASSEKIAQKLSMYLE